MRWKDPVKAVFLVVTQDYWNGWLYAIDTAAARMPSSDLDLHEIADDAELSAPGHPELAVHAGITDPDTVVFGAWADRELVAICWFQSNDANRQRRGLLPLEDDEAELAQITTAKPFRGRGVASQLIGYGAASMGTKGFRRLYAKIWYDNAASRRAFDRAGWQSVKRFVAVRVRGVNRPLTFTVRGERQTTA